MRNNYLSFVGLFFVLSTFVVSCDNSTDDDGGAGDFFNPNGYEYVELGLPSGIKWATCNIGATKPEEYGGYYAWGETEEKINDGKEDIDSNGNFYDVARVKWGGNWRMPTSDEFQELIDCCTWEWDTVNGVMGRKLTGPNGNSIFLPNAGYLGEKSVHDVGYRGYYWSASLAPYCVEAFNLYFAVGIEDNPDRIGIDTMERTQGLAVRPVSD